MSAKVRLINAHRLHFIQIIISRLDMENTILAQPETTDNQCQSDQFIVSGGTPVPALCGTLTGSHSKPLLITSPLLSLFLISVYIDMGLDNNNPIVLTVVTSGASFERSFNIKISQIECNSLSKGKELLSINVTRIKINMLQLVTGVCNTSPGSRVKCSPSTTTTPRVCSCPTPTTRCV